MNTVKKTIPRIKPVKNDEWVFVLEDLEPAFLKSQLNNITKRWENGEDILDIAKDYKRDPDEVFLALFHQARKGKTTRKFKGLYK